MDKISEIARMIAEDAADEASTIAKYTVTLGELIAEGKEEDAANLREIISDELNHLAKFAGMYVSLTGIEVSEE